MSDDRTSFTRRGALALMSAGGAVMLTPSFGFTSLRSERTTNVQVAADANAALGLIPGVWSLAVSNNTGQSLTTEAAVVAVRPSGVSTDEVNVIDNSITLGTREASNAKPGTHVFLFETANGTTPSSVDDFDVQLTVPTGNGLLLRQEVTVDTTDAEPTSTNTSEKLFIEQENTGAETLHTYGITNFTNVSDGFTNITIDYSGLNQTMTMGFLNSTRKQDVAVTAIDDSGNTQKIRIDRSTRGLADPDTNSIEIPLVEQFPTKSTETLGVALGRVGNVDLNEDGEATLTLGDTEFDIKFSKDVDID